MPNIKSAEKQMRQSEKKRLRNKSYKSAMKTQIKKFLSCIEEKKLDQAKTEFSATVSILDKIGHKNIWHPNKVDHEKKRLHAQLNALLAAGKEEKK